jgi:hypothetical protein
MESKSSSDWEGHDVFTLNPDDRYLNPVPPKPIPSSRIGDLCKESYRVPIYTSVAPRSATYLPTTRSLSPGNDYFRSVSTSPCHTSNAVFSDFKNLKEKITAHKRAASSSREGMFHRGARDLDIGAPVLISTTAEDIKLVPLLSTQIPRSSSSLPRPTAAKFREFSPLGSHPVDHRTDFDLGITNSRYNPQLRRSRSHVRSIAPSDTIPTLGRSRANSSGVRRTKLFANEPWISSPRFPREPLFDSDEKTAPTLQRPDFALSALSKDSKERPTSSHGGDRSPSLRRLPLDKELPALPQYLVPAPLFACSSAAPSPTLQDAPERNELITPASPELKNQFSFSSAVSTTFSSPTSDGGVTHSPTSSSLTSDSSESDLSQPLSEDFAHGEQTYQYEGDSASEDVFSHNTNYTFGPKRLSGADSPPVLQLTIPSFASDLLGFDTQRPVSVPWRHATYSGQEFQGYSLPEEANGSQTTITKISPLPHLPTPSVRESSTSQFDQLMSDFGYLGEALL